MTASPTPLEVGERSQWLRRADRLLARVGALYLRIERTERGFVWLHRLGPAYLFGLVAVFKSLGVLDRLTGGWESITLQMALGLAHQALSTVFFLLVAFLFLIRRRPVQRLTSPWQGLAALGGAYVMLPVALSPPLVTDLALLTAATLLMLIGTAGTIYALATLGSCFAILPEVRGLVTHGPYRLVRHPAYLFEFISFLGVAMLSPTLLTALLYAVFIALQLARMQFEEQQLARAYPEAYPRYCQRTARLIPGIY